MLALQLAVTLCLSVRSGYAQTSNTSTEFLIRFNDEGTECGVFPLTWSGGQPPYRALVIPVDQATYVYSVPASSNNTYPLELELAEGTRYTLFMADKDGRYSNSTRLQTVGARSNGTRSTCSGKISTTRTELKNYVLLGGTVAQCGILKAYFASPRESLPGEYNMTIVPLDQSFTAFDVDISATEEDGGIWNWVMGMTQGMRFTTMFNSRAGYGAGGIGGIYQVKPPANATVTCAAITPTTTVPFPTSYTTTSRLDLLGAVIRSASSASASASAASYTSRYGSPTSTSTSSSGASAAPSSTKTIIGVSATAGSIIAIFLIILCCRSKRRRRAKAFQLQNSVLTAEAYGETGRQPTFVRARAASDTARVSMGEAYRLPSTAADPLPIAYAMGASGVGDGRQLPGYTQTPTADQVPGEEQPPAYGAHGRDARL